MHNLMKMKRLEINCPDVVVLKKHVLIMSMVGEDNQPGKCFLKRRLAFLDTVFNLFFLFLLSS